MLYLAIALVIVGAIGLLNLLLTFGVIRRLREHTRLLDRKLVAGDVPLTPSVLATGSAVSSFDTTTVNGDVLTTASLGDEALVGFFSPTCGPCKAQLPAFLDTARQLSRSVAVVAVVIDETGGDDMARRLTEVARVVIEPQEGSVISAFQVTAFPSFVYVSKGVVTATGNAVAEVVPVAA